MFNSMLKYVKILQQYPVTSPVIHRGKKLNPVVKHSSTILHASNANLNLHAYKTR